MSCHNVFKLSKAAGNDDDDTVLYKNNICA